MNPISIIRGFFPSRSEQAQYLTTFIDNSCNKDTISRGTLKRLERMFNATEHHIHRQPNFECNRAAILADIQDTHDRVVPNMREGQAKVVMTAVTGMMLERVSNWHTLFDKDALCQSELYYPMHLSLKKLARPYEIGLKESASANQPPPRWINERTMSLFDAFSSKLNHSSVSNTTLDKLDAIFMRETRILLDVYDEGERPTLRAYDFGNARQPGFMNLAQMSAELERIDTALSLMEDSPAARSLQWKASVYKEHIEVAQQWWQHRALARDLEFGGHSPDFVDRKPSSDLANQARLRLGARSNPTHR